MYFRARNASPAYIARSNLWRKRHSSSFGVFSLLRELHICGVSKFVTFFFALITWISIFLNIVSIPEVIFPPENWMQKYIKSEKFERRNIWDLTRRKSKGSVKKSKDFLAYFRHRSHHANLSIHHLHFPTGEKSDTNKKRNSKGYHWSRWVIRSYPVSNFQN